MCGIAGVLHLDGKKVCASHLRDMTDALRHRGPDGEGIYLSGCVGLGHRRLSILDPSPAGKQPMRSLDGRYSLTYNGELYNFRELRKELEGYGWAFHSLSDTEVVLKALIEWGEEALLRFNGMFALALWDDQERSLLLARDRYGIKPLYYWRGPGVFLFASEIKGLLVHPEFKKDFDREALAEYLTFQNFFTDRTLFKGVRLLPPATWLRFTQGRYQQQQYWDYVFQEPEYTSSAADYVDQFDFLFRRAVERQLVSDRPLGTYLSGGMDSSSITALASSFQANLPSFTVGFDLSAVSDLEAGFDERGQAEQLSSRFQTQHFQRVLQAGDMERVIPSVVRHLEEPRVGQSYPNFLAAHLASRFVKVVLAGAGGDELFGGYPWRYYRAVNNGSYDDYLKKYFCYWQRLLPSKTLSKLLRPLGGLSQDMFEIFRGAFSGHPMNPSSREDYVNCSLYLEAKTFLHGLLVVEDKLSMAHGLETRLPFLDNDLVDFGMRLPVSMKLARLDEFGRLDENQLGGKPEIYFQAYRDGKILLRQAMQRYIPVSITQAKKQGFSGPDATWFRGRSLCYVRESLFDRHAPIQEIMDGAVLEALVQEHLDGKVNRRLLIWSFLYLNEFLQIFFDKESSELSVQGPGACQREILQSSMLCP